MNQEHKTIRETIKKMDKLAARKILQSNLPLREFQAIYHGDVEREDLNYIGEKILFCSESNVKKIRKSGYKKLAAFYFCRKDGTFSVLLNP